MSRKSSQHDYGSNSHLLLEKTVNSTMEIQKLRALAYEIFKTFNGLNLNFMKENVFISSQNPNRGNYIFVQIRKNK